MERILVGVDGSPSSIAALGWAADVAARLGLELIAARVYEPPQSELDPAFDAEARQSEEAELATWCAANPAGLAGIRPVLLDGEAPDALLACAVDEHVDLLVVGGGTAGLRRHRLGSTAHHLAHETTVPLVVVPRTEAPALDHLVVGLDGSGPSAAAAELAAQLGRGLGIGATVVYALDPIPEWVPEDDPRSWKHRATEAARDWAAPISDAGVAVDVDIDRDTHPVAALVRALEAHPGSIAVVGTRGLGGFTELRLGHIPLQLMHHTSAPVMLVPPN